MFERVMNIGSAVSKTVEAHAPEIALGVGIASMVGATIFACKGTIKAKKTVEDAKDDMETIAKTEEAGRTYDDDNNPIEYTHENSMRDRVIVCKRTAVELAKAYGPAIILTAVGIFSLIKGHNILQKRNLALAAAYEGISEAYRKYRDKVKDILGEETARDLKLGLKDEEIEVDTGKKNKDGTPKMKKEKRKIIDPANGFSPYSRIYDASCKAWEDNPAYNYTVLMNKQAWWSDQLKIRPNHTVFLNEVLDDLGFPVCEAGQVVGWSLCEGHDSDGYIDFGFTDLSYEPNRDFMNGYEPCCLLDFNVDDKPVINCIPKWGIDVKEIEVDDGSVQA